MNICLWQAGFPPRADFISRYRTSHSKELTQSRFSGICLRMSREKFLCYGMAVRFTGARKSKSFCLKKQMVVSGWNVFPGILLIWIRMKEFGIIWKGQAWRIRYFPIWKNLERDYGKRFGHFAPIRIWFRPVLRKQDVFKYKIDDQ